MASQSHTIRVGTGQVAGAGATTRVRRRSARRRLLKALTSVVCVLCLGLGAAPVAGAVTPALSSPAGAVFGPASADPLATERLVRASAASSETAPGVTTGASAAGPAPQPVAGTAVLFGVACASRSSCLAVGQNASGEDVLVPITNGVPGSAITGADQVSLSEIACVSTTSCVAVGINAARTKGVVVPITAGVLGAAEPVSGTGALADVACDPSGACMASGLNEHFTEGVVVPLSGGHAGAAQSVPSTANLSGITCPASGSCLSVGTNAEFSAGVVVPIHAGVPQAAEPAAGTSSLSDIDCRASSVCTAVGSVNFVDLVVVPVISGVPGTAQSTPEVPLAVEIGLFPFAVACPSTELCLTAGGDDDQILGALSPIVGGVPGIEQDVAGTSIFTDLGCPSAAHCVAVGQTLSGEGFVLSFPLSGGAPADTTVSVAPTSSSFGQAVSATVAVSSSAGTPTGEVYFAVDGVFPDYPQRLDGSGQTVFTIHGLAPGSHTITAAYVGPTGTFSPGRTYYEPGSATATAGVTCATTITGQQNQSFTITQPATCLSGAQVSGSINVQRGASLSIDSSTINGSVNANGAGVFRMCASTVGGSLNITNASGYVLVGDRAPNEDFDACAANTIHGSMSLVNDTSGARAIGNSVGGAIDTLNDSRPGGYTFERSPALAPNTFLGSGQSTFLAGRQSGAQGQTVDGIQCFGNEQFVSHYHAHLAIFAHGKSLAVPEGIGMVGPLSEFATPYGPYAFTESGCIYWVHVHDQTGMIHMELPAAFTVTLGAFFDLWGQPLSSNQAGPQRGSVTAFVNGFRYNGNPRNIVLGDHTLVQLDIGGPTVPPQPFEFTATNR